MIDLTGVTHHQSIEEITSTIVNKTQSDNELFFRPVVAYFLAKVASNMRATIVTKDRGEIPVNMYSLSLGTSGIGKGYSVNIMEKEFISKFEDRFKQETMHTLSNQHLHELARDRSINRNTDETVEYDALHSEYVRSGPMLFTFDSGSVPATKQLRHHLLLASCGAISLQIDEIGSNLIGSTELLNLFLELYDQGLVKQKIKMSTNEAKRVEEINGKTPANLLLFGSPAKLLDGSLIENQFYSFLDVGYARRCIFGLGQPNKNPNNKTASEIYTKLTDPSNQIIIDKWSEHFFDLADPIYFNWKMNVSDPVAILLLEYKLHCEKLVSKMKEHEEIRKAEMTHRYFKVLKLAGTYAFIDQAMEVEEIHIKQAILLVEESGICFEKILTREKTYVKLARYIADMGTELTHADLMEALPFYKSGTAARNELINLATAWGYKNNHIIKKRYVDGIEFYCGERLLETNLEEISISYSDHWAYNYEPEKVPFNELHQLTQADGYHWSNHSYKNKHRSRENVISGFNIVVIDIDEGCSLESVHNLLSEFTFMTYTTKRHQQKGHDRFRIILPINYYLKLDADDYREFMNNILEYLPFESDTSSNQIEKKWESFNGGSYHYNNTGKLLDVLPFIPRTSKNEQYLLSSQKLHSLDNLEKWFAERIAEGNRNKQMLKYALALVDNGMSIIEVQNQVLAFNSKINNPLDVSEIDKTIMVTVGKHFIKKQGSNDE